MELATEAQPPRHLPKRFQVPVPETSNIAAETEAADRLDAASPDCQRDGCTTPARHGSQYCSDTCGMIVNHRRLPQLLHHFASVAATQSVDQLRDVCKAETQRMEDSALEIERLHKKLTCLLSYIDYVKEVPVSDDALAADKSAKRSKLDVVAACPNCHKEMDFAELSRHMPQCFKQISTGFDLSTATRNTVPECPIQAYCNHHHAKLGYCTRLYYSCMEHGYGKELWKSSAKTICGYPLEALGTEADTSHFAKLRKCMQPQSRCPCHPSWRYFSVNEVAQELVTQAIVRNINGEAAARAEREWHKNHLLLLRLAATTDHFGTPEAQAAAMLQVQQDALAQHIEKPPVGEVAADWQLRRRELDPPAQFDQDRPRVTGGTQDLPRRHWR